jgi:IclR family transcriptional regulator, acetate operon repressor
MAMADAAVTTVRCGRGVLESAFMLLDVLSRVENGLGLTELTRETGLPKSTAHRLAEKLVDIGAAQRVKQRYFVGPTIARLGQGWQPDPQLRQAAHEPVRALATQAHTAAAVYVLHQGRAHLVTAAVCPGQSWLPPGDLNPESLPPTAVARVLLAASGEGRAAAGIPAGQRRRPRSDLRDWQPFVTDDQGATEGLGWVAAPVWPVEGRCSAAVAAVVAAPALPPLLKDLVVCAARQIGQQLR